MKPIVYLCLLLAFFSLETRSQDETPICDYACVQRDIFDGACGGVQCTYDFEAHPEPEKLCTEECLNAVKNDDLVRCVAVSDPFRKFIDRDTLRIAVSLDNFCLEHAAEGSEIAEDSDLEFVLSLFGG